MRFDLVDLRLFVHVHEAGTITGGAARSHMTLASASERIRGMEDAIGVPLLTRERRGVAATPAGRVLLRHARLVLREVDALGDEMARHGKGLAGTIRLFCNTSALSEHLPRPLATFLTAHPRLCVELEERPSDDIVDALLDESCDLGIASDAADRAGLQSVAFVADPLVLVVPRGHRLAERGVARFVDVLDEPFVGLLEGSALQAHVGRHARRLRKRPAYRVRVASFESVCRMVGLGIGVGIVPLAAALRCRRTCGIAHVALDDAWAARNLVLCMRDVDALPAPVRSLVQHLVAEAAGRRPVRRRRPDPRD